jgi:glycosyltransferase involved in cell wall biosynthesis
VVHILESLKTGGAETLVRHLAAGFEPSEFELILLSVYQDRLSESERLSLRARSISIGRKGRSDLSFFPRLVAALRELHPDIVHCHISAGRYAGRAAAILAEVPAIVFTEHGGDPWDLGRSVINRVLHARTARFVTFTESQRRRFAASEHVALDRISVIPNGVAIPPTGDRFELRRQLGIAPSAFALYLPARLTQQKNQVLAIKAFAEIASSRENWRLVIAGAGPLENLLRAETAKLLPGRVAFLGFREDASALCRCMDAFVMCSTWERMPLALGEAMRAGLPVVSTPWDGVEDFLGDGVTAILSSGYSVAEFTHALLRLEDRRLCASISARARQFADDVFDIDSCVRRHATLYREVLSLAGSQSPVSYSLAR